MDTSSSTNESVGALHWSAGVFLFSGRPDPEWNLEPIAVAEFMGIWHALDRSPVEPLDQTRVLGYRGCFIRNSQGELWAAFERVVTLDSPGHKESRSDPAKKFEMKILATAPDSIMEHLANFRASSAQHKCDNLCDR
jgi:hypothetical protein